MNQHYGNAHEFVILLHGGAGPQDPSEKGLRQAQASLIEIGEAAREQLIENRSPVDVATLCLQKLEADPQFNAGVGSALQSDGVARLSASLMDGEKQRFSGVVSTPYLSHPSALSLALQERSARVLTTPGSELLARELGLPVQSNLTEKRSQKWMKKLTDSKYRALEDATDTVGCVIRSASGHLVAASSTGGRGFEFPGRVSDSSSVAGNYASQYAAVTVTGVGEEIVDDAVAARLDCRIRDGMSLEDSSRRCHEEAVQLKRNYGWIVLDARLRWGVAHTTSHMPFMGFDKNGPLSLRERLS